MNQTFSNRVLLCVCGGGGEGRGHGILQIHLVWCSFVGIDRVRVNSSTFLFTHVLRLEETNSKAKTEKKKLLTQNSKKPTQSFHCHILRSDRFRR